MQGLRRRESAAILHPYTYIPAPMDGPGRILPDPAVAEGTQTPVPTWLIVTA